jgi:hypothetical protein
LIKIKENITHRKTSNTAFNTLLCSLLVNEISLISLIDNCSKKNILFNLATGPFVALRFHKRTTMFPSMDPKINIERYRFIHAVIYYVS